MAILTTLAGFPVDLPDVVYISSTDLHSWTETELPYDFMSLTIYQSKFVAVGGWDLSTREATNTILTSTTGRQWEPSLPPMPTKRYYTSSVSTTSPEVLVVAGGRGSDHAELIIVEVLMIGQWITIDPLPAPASDMASTFHDGNSYFMTRGDTSNTIMTCSCISLMSSCTDSSRTSSTDSPLWSQFQAPGGRQSIVSYSSQLVIIDGRGTARGYSSTTQSWVEASIAGDRPDDYNEFAPATVLPTGEILYCHEYGGVYRGTILGEICTLMQLVNMYVYIDSLHLCMCCVFHMQLLYMCRYACTCIVKYSFSMYVLCIDRCICMSTLHACLQCSIYFGMRACIWHASMYFAMRHLFWHAGMYLAYGHVFGIRACIWRAGHVFGMRAFILACGACIWHAGMYLAYGHLF